MFTVRIEGIEELKRGLTDIGRNQVPFAAAKALTQTAKAVERKIQDAMAGAFASASPYVRRATFVSPAKKSLLEAVVGLKDQKPSGGTAPAVLLKEHFTGGRRGHKPFEKAIASLGGFPSGWRAIPGRGMKLDAYGNPNKNMIGEMLGSLRTRRQVWKGRGKKVALTGYFMVKVGERSNLHPGIYYRPNRGALLCLFVFVQQAAYRKAIDMVRIANEAVAREFQPNFDTAFKDAMATAR